LRTRFLTVFKKALRVLKKALRVLKKALRVLKKALRVLKKALRVLKNLIVITVQTPERVSVQNVDMTLQEHKYGTQRPSL
jgi:hypothetical protein